GGISPARAGSPRVVRLGGPRRRGSAVPARLFFGGGGRAPLGPRVCARAGCEVLTRPHRRGAGDRRWATVAAKLGLPVAARAGVGFAFEPDPGGYSRPAGSGILGTVAALVILVGSLVFGASLSNLVSHPPLYGWAWDA